MSSGVTIDVRAPLEQSEGTRAQLLRWLKSVGERVLEHEPLIEVETEKVTVEIPAPAAGVLREILKHEQDAIDPGEVLGRIEVGAVDEAPQVAATPVHAAATTPAAGAIALPPRVIADDRNGGQESSRGRARQTSPAVRRLLEKNCLNIEAVRATGPDGAVTVDDVLAAAANPEASGALAKSGAHEGRRVPHSPTRRHIAEHMVRSLLQTAPHVTTVFEADISAVLHHRARHRDDYQQRGAPLTLTAYVLAACVSAIRVVPEVNARWHEDALEIFDFIDINVATAIEGKGLAVPVLRAVQTLNLFQLASGLARLVNAAREGRLTPQEVRGGTFTVSNHGVSGSLLAAPVVINQPQVAILGVGRLEKRAVVVEQSDGDAIVVQPRCFLTLTIDHRAMDGDRANQFMTVLVQRLENWPLAEV